MNWLHNLYKDSHVTHYLESVFQISSKIVNWNAYIENQIINYIPEYYSAILLIIIKTISLQ